MSDRHIAADRDNLAREQREQRRMREEWLEDERDTYDLDALEAALGKSTPGEARLLDAVRLFNEEDLDE